MSDDEVPKYRTKKDTKRWCKGRVGIKHEPRWIADLRFSSGAMVFACAKCGKHFDWYSPLFGRKYEQPVLGSTEPKKRKA